MVSTCRVRTRVAAALGQLTLGHRVVSSSMHWRAVCWTPPNLAIGERPAMIPMIPKQPDEGSVSGGRVASLRCLAVERAAANGRQSPKAYSSDAVIAGACPSGNTVMMRARLDPGLQASSDSGNVDSDFASPDSRNRSSARNILERRGRIRGRQVASYAPLPTTSVFEIHEIHGSMRGGRQIWILRIPEHKGPAPPGRKVAILQNFGRPPSTAQRSIAKIEQEGR
ncbi:hypothetical protein B0T18DRAFT_390947 [Schizothecium vesticola]|uniref:Uncharacterized protein n=1 Tax=Schizothecium vesticola TaxID=314040 RepID=A0AA40EW60_9PEZI|nr:hypothetical protein B0T18DRAFT_390947 [Schizothecium vesticola]